MIVGGNRGGGGGGGKFLAFHIRPVTIDTNNR